jgi:predicted small secreted protein
MRTFLTLSAIAAATLFLHACNTVEGVGEDMQAGGSAVEEAANDSK